MHFLPVSMNARLSAWDMQPPARTIACNHLPPRLHVWCSAWDMHTYRYLRFGLRLRISLAQKDFVGVGSIDIGGVEWSDPGVDSMVDEGDHVLFRLWRVVGGRHAHASKSLCWYFKTLWPQLDPFHCCHLSCSYLICFSRMTDSVCVRVLGSA